MKIKIFHAPAFLLLIFISCFGRPCFSAEQIIRFDGVYVSERQTASNVSYWEYLRFFADNTIIATSTTDRPEKLQEWFIKEHANVYSGSFAIRDKTISFSTVALGKNIDYAGEVANGRLYLQVFSHITQTRVKHEYVFVPSAFFSTFKMPDAAPAPGVADSVTHSSNVPAYFIGTFEDEVPRTVGGSVPEIKFAITCDAILGCLEGFGDKRGDSFEKVAPTASLKYAREALSYARTHRNNIVSSSPTYWRAKHLQPLLDSDAEIDSCIDLSGTATSGIPELPAGAPSPFLLCKVTNSPWSRPVVLFMAMSLGYCGDLFCGYEIFPAFRKSEP